MDEHREKTRKWALDRGMTEDEFDELWPDPMDEAKRAEWIAHLDWHGHDIEVEVS